MDDDRMSFLRSAPFGFSLYNRDGPNRVEIFDITRIPSCRSAISETTSLCDIFGDDCEWSALSSDLPNGTLANVEDEESALADDSPNDSSGSYDTANGSEQLSDTSDIFEDSRGVLSPVPPPTASLPEARCASPLSKFKGLSLDPQTTPPLAQSVGIPSALRSVASSSLSPEPRSANVSREHRTAASPHNPSIKFPSLEASCSGLSSEHISHKSGAHASPYEHNGTAPSPEPWDADVYYEAENATPTPEDGDIISHTTETRGTERRITAITPDPRSSSPELQHTRLESSVASFQTGPESSSLEMKVRAEIPESEPRNISPKPELKALSAEPAIQATFSEPGARAESPKIKTRTTSHEQGPSAASPGPESRALFYKLEPSVTYAEPETRDKSPVINPRAISPKKELNAILPEPEPSATSPQPEPSAISLEPEPSATSPQPEPSAISLEPGPSATSPQPEPSAISLEPEPSATSPQPEPSAISLEPEPSATSPQPETCPAPPEPEFTTQIQELKASAKSPESEFGTLTQEPEPSETSQEPDFRPQFPEPEPSDSSPSPDFRTSFLEPNPSAISPEPEFRTPSPEPNATSPDPDCIASFIEPQLCATSPAPEFRTPSPEPSMTSPEPDLRTPFLEPQHGAIFPEPESRTPPAEPELSVTSQEPDPEPEFKTQFLEPEPSATGPDPDFRAPCIEPQFRATSPEPGPSASSPEPGTSAAFPESESSSTPPKPGLRSNYSEFNTINSSSGGRISANSPEPGGTAVFLNPNAIFPSAEPIETVPLRETTVTAHTTEPKASSPTADPRIKDPLHEPTQTNPSPETRTTNLSIETKTASHGLETLCSTASPEPPHRVNSHEQRNSELSSEPSCPTTYAECENTELFELKGHTPGFSGTATAFELGDWEQLLKPTTERAYTSCPHKHSEKEGGRMTYVPADSNAGESLQSAQPLFSSEADLIRPPGTRKREAGPSRETAAEDPELISVPQEPEVSTSGESPTVKPRQGANSSPHRDKGLREGGEGGEEEEGHKIEEQGADEGESSQGKASYEEQQVELSFSARNRRAPESPSSAPTCRQPRKGMPAGCYSDCLLATQQRQQQNLHKALSSQKENQARARKPRLILPPTRSSASQCPAPEYSSMGSELDEADDEVKWFTDQAFRSLSSPHSADYLDVYNSSHRSSTNVSQLSTEGSPGASAWSAYADLRGSIRHNGDNLAHQPHAALAPDRLDTTRRTEVGNFECVDVALESREDVRTGKRTVPKRQIHLKRRDVSEPLVSENDEAAADAGNEAQPVQRHSRDALLRQHSTPAAIHGESCEEIKLEPKQKLQKSLSLDETSCKTKTATGLIKSVLSKKMHHNQILAVSQPSLQSEDSSSAVGKNASSESPISVTETPKMEGSTLSSELPSDYSLSEEDFPLQIESAPLSHSVKQPRSFDPKPQPKPLGRYRYGPLLDGTSSLEFHRNNTGRHDMRSELVIPFESPRIERRSSRETWKWSCREKEIQSKKEMDKQQHGSYWKQGNGGAEKLRARDLVKQQSNRKLCERHSGDSANGVSANTGAAATQAPSALSGMTNRNQECYTKSENYKQQSARRIFTFKTPEIMLQPCSTTEKKNSSLMTDCLPGDSAPKQEEGHVAPLPERLPEKETERHKMENKTGERTENGDALEKSKARAPVHKVRDVRKMVKNTYNLSFKATAVLAQDTASPAEVEKPTPMQIEYVSRKVEGPATSRPSERQAEGEKAQVYSQETAPVHPNVPLKVHSQETTKVSAQAHPNVPEQVHSQETAKVSAQAHPNVPEQVHSQETTKVSAQAHPNVPEQVHSQETTKVSAQAHPNVPEQVHSLETTQMSERVHPPEFQPQVPVQASPKKVTQTASLQITPRGRLTEPGAATFDSAASEAPGVSETSSHVERARHPKLGSTPKLPSKDREVSTLMFLQNGPPEGELEPGALPPLALTATSCSRSVSMLLKEKGFQADIGVCDTPANDLDIAQKHVNTLEVPLQIFSTESTDPVPRPICPSPSAPTPSMEEHYSRKHTPSLRELDLERSLKPRENNTRAQGTTLGSPQTTAATSSDRYPLSLVKTVSTCTGKPAPPATGSLTSSCKQQSASGAAQLHSSDTQMSAALATSSKEDQTAALSASSCRKQKHFCHWTSSPEQPNLTHSDAREQVGLFSSCSSSCSQSSVSTAAQSLSCSHQRAISITSTKGIESSNQRYYARDDPPSYDERESFSPLLLTDLYSRKTNRYHPPVQAPPCSCAADGVPCPGPPDLSPLATGPSSSSQAPPSHTQAPPCLNAPPPARHHHQQRSDGRSLSYKPGSPKGAPPSLAQVAPHPSQPLHHLPPSLPACPPPPPQPRPENSRQLPPGLPLDRRPGHQRSPQHPASLSGSSTYSSHSTQSPGVPPLEVRPQYLCTPPGFVSSYGSDYGGEGGGGSGILYPEGGGGLGYGQSPRRVLLDPETGKYFYIEVPVQPLRKMLFDPETGQYVEVLIPQQTLSHSGLSHSGLYPPVAAPYPSMHSPGMYAPQYLPYTVPPHSQPPSPRHPEAPPPPRGGLHQSNGGFGTPHNHSPKTESQIHPPLDQGYLESMYYIPTGMNASPNPAPPEFYQKLPPNLPNLGGKRS